jgi:arylsulfatase A-like enzyme
MFATCAALVGHTLPDDAAEDSSDLSPVLRGEASGAEPIRDTLIVNSTGSFFTVRRGPWKLIPFRGSGGFSAPKLIRDVPPGEPQGQLYNLTEDPAETKNVYAEHPKIVAELTELLERSQREGRTRGT